LCELSQNLCVVVFQIRYHQGTVRENNNFICFLRNCHLNINIVEDSKRKILKESSGRVIFEFCVVVLIVSSTRISSVGTFDPSHTHHANRATSKTRKNPFYDHDNNLTHILVTTESHYIPH
jgi:hypothetical protein